MKTKIGLFICILFFSGTAFGQEPSASEDCPSCYIMYDAGSSGTRLYIYEKKGTDWIEHEGPKVSALADPVREIRGKTRKDIETVTTEVVSALDAIKQDGPVKEGKPKWKAFDWTGQCNVVAANIFATAGMRIAEQENRGASAELWKTLEHKLIEKVGKSVAVATRTITGYEEGLYAWLAVRKEKNHNQFGIVEIGGSSSQVTFPCSQCDGADDATRTVMVEGRPLQIYSYSFLGLGQNEAPRTLGVPPSCEYGIGSVDPAWKAEDCADRISIMDVQGIRDPYNYNGNERGTHNRVPIHRADVADWFLTGAFNYMKDSEFNTCARPGVTALEKRPPVFERFILESTCGY